MTQLEIDKIEAELVPDGLTGYLFHLAYPNRENLFEVVYISGIGACMVMKGDYDVIVRRQQFIDVYDGFKNVSQYLKNSAK